MCATTARLYCVLKESRLEENLNSESFVFEILCAGQRILGQVWQLTPLSQLSGGDNSVLTFINLQFSVLTFDTHPLI